MVSDVTPVSMTTRQTKTSHVQNELSCNVGVENHAEADESFRLRPYLKD